MLQIQEAIQPLTRRGDLRSVVTAILQGMVEELGITRACVAQLDVDRDTILNVTGVNLPQNLSEMYFPAKGPSVLLETLRTGKTAFVEDAGRDTRVAESMRPFYIDAGMFSFAAVPLLPVPFALLVSKNRPITDKDITELTPFTGQLLVALWSSQLQEEWRHSGSQQAAENDALWKMLDSVPDPVILTDEENNILHQNAQAEKLFKSSPSDGAGKRRAIELNNFLMSAALSSFVLDQGSTTLGRELTLVDPDEGSELLCEVISRHATSRGSRRGLVTVIKDVTSLRQAGQELSRSLREVQRTGEEARLERDRLQNILQNVAEPIVVTNLSNEIILMNPPAERILAGHLANETKLTTFLLQLNLDTGADSRRAEIQLSEPITLEPLAMSVTATKVRDSFGQVVANVSILHDLTQVRELERRRLEQQLFESEKLAAVGRLAATIAHEINNPLEAIKNAVYAVVSHIPADAPDRKLLEIAKSETERVSRIVRQMLGLYRSESPMTMTDVNQVLEEVLILLRGQFVRAGVKVRSEFYPRLPEVPAVSDQLKQVFLNLLVNAQEAMNGGGEITVVTRLSRAGDDLMPGRYLMVEVNDTGPGIPEENLHKIFDPFFSTKRERKGTGLGLWVSLDIVQRHNGQLKVRTRLGRGSTFTVALPIGGDDGKPSPVAHSR